MRAFAWLLAFVWPLGALRDVDFDFDLDGDIHAALKPKGTLVSAAPAPEAAPPGGDHPGLFDEIRRNITVHPGEVGMVREGRNYIRAVVEGSQAQHAGLKAGDRLVALNGDSFKDGVFIRLRSGKVTYTITAASPSMMVSIFQKTSMCLQIPASLMGCFFLLGMIPFYRSHQRMGSDWQDDRLAGVLVCPAGVISVGALVVREVAEVLAESNFLRDAHVVRLATSAGHMLYCVGLLYCLVVVLGSPLLATRLPEIAVARWRCENKGMWLCATILVLLEAAKLADYSATTPQGFQDVTLWEYACDRVVAIMLDMLLLEVVATITRTVGAVEHRVLQLQNSLSCKAADFSEQVHAPCAELVTDTCPQLAPLGFPLLCLTSKVLMNAVNLYECLKLVVDSGTYHVRVHAIILSIEMVAAAFAIAVAPVRLSSALDALYRRLSEVRCNTPELHVQVQVAESMLRQSNGGRGWGIEVCRGVVLNKEFLQAAFIRAALVATGVIAFLDSQMGIGTAERKEDTIEAEVSGIRHMLTNITTHLNITHK